MCFRNAVYTLKLAERKDFSWQQEKNSSKRRISNYISKFYKKLKNCRIINECGSFYKKIFINIVCISVSKISSKKIKLFFCMDAKNLFWQFLSVSKGTAVLYFIKYLEMIKFAMNFWRIQYITLHSHTSCKWKPGHSQISIEWLRLSSSTSVYL